MRMRVSSLPPAFHQILVSVDAAVAEERPDAAEILDLFEVEIVGEDFLVFDGGFGDEFTVGIGDEGLAPELGAVVGAGAVDGGEVATVGDGVAALHGFPGAVLGGSEAGFFRRQPTDGGGIDEDLCAAECHEAGGFGIPLVPTDEDADFAEFRVPDRPAAVAGGEIEFFLETGVLRNVSFAIKTHQRAVGVVDGGGVVIKAGSAVLEQRRNEDDAEFTGDFPQAIGDRAGQGIREVEEVGVLNSAEIGREEKFLGDDDVGTVFRRLADESFVVVE